MKKKIAFVMDQMKIGGIEKSLIELLDAIDYSRFEITLYLASQEGALMEYINSKVRIHQWNNQAKKQIEDDIRSLNVSAILKQIKYRFLLRMGRKDWRKEQLYSTYTYPFYSDSWYDCVIAYQINSPSVVASSLKKINANKRIAFYHGKSASVVENTKFWDNLFQEFDKIYCVSKYAEKEFTGDYPLAGRNTDIFYNILDSDKIIEKSRRNHSKTGFMHSGISILTVGRLSPEKGQMLIPRVAHILVNQGYDFYWYLLGDGYMKEDIAQEIKKYNVDERVVLLGEKNNPYPYIRRCDIYVQPSFSEGWGLTVQEARILAKPIVVTPVPVMAEQINSGENGLIVDAMTPEAIADGIRQLLDHPELMEKFTNALKNESIDNSAELQKLYDFIES